MCPHPPSPRSPEARVKRPMNAFMLWAKDQRKCISASNPDMSNAEVSASLGKRWSVLLDEEKQPYLDEAARIRRQHRLDNPSYYKHCPRTRPLTKDKGVVEKTQAMVDKLLEVPDLWDILQSTPPRLPSPEEGDCGDSDTTTSFLSVTHDTASSSAEAADHVGPSPTGTHSAVLHVVKTEQVDDSAEHATEAPSGLAPKSGKKPAGKKTTGGSGGSRKETQRPPNAFLLWAKKTRPKVAKRFPDSPNWEISMVLGELWNTCPEDRKHTFQDEAKTLRRLHRQDNPELYKRCKSEKLPSRTEQEIAIEPEAKTSTMQSMLGTPSPTCSPASNDPLSSANTPAAEVTGQMSEYALSQAHLSSPSSIATTSTSVETPNSGTSEMQTSVLSLSNSDGFMSDHGGQPIFQSDPVRPSFCLPFGGLTAFEVESVLGGLESYPPTHPAVTPGTTLLLANDSLQPLSTAASAAGTDVVTTAAPTFTSTPNSSVPPMEMTEWQLPNVASLFHGHDAWQPDDPFFQQPFFQQTGNFHQSGPFFELLGSRHWL